MEVAFLPGETVVKHGFANLQRGWETVGGALCLTNERLIFQSHAINIQRGATIIPLTAVSATTTCWTRFLNVIPVAPNSLAVLTEDRSEHRFVLFGRRAWKEAIDAQRALVSQRHEVKQSENEKEDHDRHP